jgi:hypothetical protein
VGGMVTPTRSTRLETQTRCSRSRPKQNHPKNANLPGLADLDTRKSRNVSSEDGSVVLREIHSLSKAHCQLPRSDTNEFKDRRTKPQHGLTSFAQSKGGVKLPAGRRCNAFSFLSESSEACERLFL